MECTHAFNQPQVALIDNHTPSENLEKNRQLPFALDSTCNITCSDSQFLLKTV